MSRLLVSYEARAFDQAAHVIQPCAPLFSPASTFFNLLHLCRKQIHSEHISLGKLASYLEMVTVK
jgi:hypothetical protein